MTGTPFDELASTYAEAWSGTEQGRSQRVQVWRWIDRAFHAGDRVLDLGCGTGDDAVHLRERGVSVLGIDASPRMVEIARSRGVSAERLPIEELAVLEGAFTSALSNFGALNCVPDLSHAVAQLARLIQPGGIAALCVMGRFSWRETLRYLASLDWKRATRRWSGRSEWRGMQVYYRSAGEMARAFREHFALERRISIGGGDHQLYLFRRNPA